tara:strand:- start:722 stop:973 length:252 start_codon:yes stop_codon:yes gene_type:complete
MDIQDDNIATSIAVSSYRTTTNQLKRKIMKDSDKHSSKFSRNDSGKCIMLNKKFDNITDEIEKITNIIFGIQNEIQELLTFNN